MSSENPQRCDTDSVKVCSYGCKVQTSKKHVTKKQSLGPYWHTATLTTLSPLRFVACQLLLYSFMEIDIMIIIMPCWRLPDSGREMALTRVLLRSTASKGASRNNDGRSAICFHTTAGAIFQRVQCVNK